MPLLPDSWTQVLDNVRQALEESLARAAEREQAIPPPAPEEWEARWRSLAERLQGRPDGLDGLLRRAEAEAAAADAALAEAGEAAGGWLRAAAETGQRLAKWATDSV